MDTSFLVSRIGYVVNMIKYYLGDDERMLEARKQFGDKDHDYFWTNIAKIEKLAADLGNTDQCGTKALELGNTIAKFTTSMEEILIPKEDNIVRDLSMYSLKLLKFAFSPSADLDMVKVEDEATEVQYNNNSPSINIDGMLIIAIGHSISLLKVLLNTYKRNFIKMLGSKQYKEIQKALDDVKEMACTFGKSSNNERGEDAFKLGGYISTFCLYVTNITEYELVSKENPELINMLNLYTNRLQNPILKYMEGPNLKDIELEVGKDISGSGIKLDISPRKNNGSILNFKDKSHTRSDTDPGL
jgi:hypothetical protein